MEAAQWLDNEQAVTQNSNTSIKQPLTMTG